MKSKYDLGPDAPLGCNGKPGTSGIQLHKKNGEEPCKNCRIAYAWYQTIRRQGQGYVREKAISARERSEYYPYKHGSRYFHLEKDRDEYAWRDRVRKAAKRAGWAYETIEDLIKFDTQRGIRQREIDREKHSQRIIKARRKEIRRDNNLPDNAKLTQQLVANHLAQGVGAAIKRRRSTLDDAEKLAMIKQMIEDRTPIHDFMIRTSQLVGVDLRKVSNGNV